MSFYLEGMYRTRKVSFPSSLVCSILAFWHACALIKHSEKESLAWLYSAIFQKDASSVAKKGGVYHCLAIELRTFFVAERRHGDTTWGCLRLHCSFMSHLLFRRFHSLSQLLQWEDFYFFATKQLLLHSKPKWLQIESLLSKLSPWW